MTTAYEGVSSAAALLHLSQQALTRRVRNGSFPAPDIGIGDFHRESEVTSLHSLNAYIREFRSIPAQMGSDMIMGWSRDKVINFGIMAGLLKPDGTIDPERKTGGHVTRDNFLTFPQDPLRAVYLSVKAIQRLTPMTWNTARARLGLPDVIIANHFGGWHPQRVVDVLTQAAA